MIRHYYFTERETGEEFIVGARDYVEAESIALDIGDILGANYGVEPAVFYEYEMTDEEAESSGLDEY